MKPPVVAYVFDLYGTLLDYGSLRSHFEGSVTDPAAFVASWREKQLHYALAASAMDRYTDFETLTSYAFAYAAEKHGLATDGPAVAAACRLWSELPAFADVVPALDAIRSRGYRTAVLSNGTPRAIERGVRAAGIADLFDALLSVDTVRTYKPSPTVYALAAAHFGVPAAQIAFVSSNGWDVTGGAEFGFTTIWCNRSGVPAERFGATPDRVVSGLEALPNA